MAETGTRKKLNPCLDKVLLFLQMPRMNSSSVQCCLCVVGVFMFLFGVIMVSLGVCLVLNYGLFDSKFLPEELRSDDGKRIVGIILISTGLASDLISVIVSTWYLCTRSKSQSVSDLSKIPDSGRKTSENKHRKPNEHSKSKPTEQPSRGLHSGAMPTNSINMRKKHKRKRKKLVPNRARLEGIQEADSKSIISRKPSEADLEALQEDEERVDSNTPVEQFTYSQEVDIKDENKEVRVSMQMAQFSITDETGHEIKGSYSEINVKAAQEKDSLDNSSSESGYTDSVATTSDRFDFEEQINRLVR